ncbi:type II secretion system ATPase PulE [Propionigenium maris DSM 9537]|uniref:Type II secretion system ATPase PulE n=1 Tax=Propionigenium maris DSM 9537 TaxID=1123000 RepID=A0A9W6GPN6_9FUSO|nr:GspE/PulE family protein [Propionigenium maris]GLI57552.1 type II secretion system ATPase PulE [Propionigenium maris DSM 9537]
MLKKMFKKRKDDVSTEKRGDLYENLYKQDSLVEIIRAEGVGDPILITYLDNLIEEETTDERVIDLLLRGKVMDEEKLFKAVGRYLHLPYRYVEEISFSDEVLTLMKTFETEFIERNRVIILEVQGERAEVAVSTLNDVEVKDIIQSRLNNIQVDLCLISSSVFNRLYNIYQDKLSIIHEIKEVDFGRVDDKDMEIDDLTNEDNPVVKLVNNILVEAVRVRSSDIHIEPYRDRVLIKNRIDGVLIEDDTSISKTYHEAIISRIKILSKLNIADHRIPQDGRLKKVVNNREVDFRVSILPTVFGESVVIRILDKRDEVLLLEGLGTDSEEKRMILKNASLPYGMVLVTGPTGSGKTTTLYAILNEIRSSKEKIITIEDPVEYQLGGVVQIPVNEKSGLTFAKGLRSILRQDPDKIMVGEIRDRETAEIAIQAALTGHLVISTLHSNNTVEAIGRLTNIGVDSYQFASALNLVVGQRLMRKRCEKCSGEGCLECNRTGYHGRTGIYELFELDEDIKEMIIQGESPIRIKERAVEKGMKDLKENAALKVKGNITSVDEYERVIGVWEGE